MNTNSHAQSKSPSPRVLDEKEKVMTIDLETIGDSPRLMPLSNKEGSVLEQFNLLLKAAEDVPALFVQMEAMFHKLMGPDLKKIRFLVLD